VSTESDPGFESLISGLHYPDDSRIAPRVTWIHCLVGLSHFAKFLRNLPVTVREMVINLLKSSIPQW